MENSDPSRNEIREGRLKKSLSKRVYEGYVGISDMPAEFYRWMWAEQFGWTLEEADRVSVADLHEYLQVMDGRYKGSTSLVNK